MTVAVSVAAAASEVVAGSQVRWTVLVVNLDTVAAAQGSLSFPLVTGCVAASRTGRGGGLGATGVTTAATVGWISDSSLVIPAGGSAWYTVDDTVAANTFGAISATATFTPQTGSAVSATGSVSSASGITPLFVPTSIPSCTYCEPVEAGVVASTFEALPSGQEAVMFAQVRAGNEEMRNARIAIWLNPNAIELPVGSQANFDRWARPETIADIRIPWLPADSVLVLDGRTKDMTLTCGTSVVPGEPYVLVNDPVFEWPVLTCYDAAVAFIFDAYNTAVATAGITVEFVPRFRL